MKFRGNESKTLTLVRDEQVDGISSWEFVFIDLKNTQRHQLDYFSSIVICNLLLNNSVNELQHILLFSCRK